MNPEIKDRWLTALRSGEYKQGKGYLRQADDTFCCLGVLADIAVKDGACPVPELKANRAVPHYTYDSLSGDLTIELSGWAGLEPYDDVQSRLMGMNDDYGLSFEQIADWIEENL